MYMDVKITLKSLKNKYFFLEELRRENHSIFCTNPARVTAEKEEEQLKNPPPPECHCGGGHSV